MDAEHLVLRGAVLVAADERGVGPPVGADVELLVGDRREGRRVRGGSGRRGLGGLGRVVLAAVARDQTQTGHDGGQEPGVLGHRPVLGVHLFPRVMGRRHTMAGQSTPLRYRTPRPLRTHAGPLTVT